MTDFKEGGIERCHLCGRKYNTAEGKECECWKCTECGEEFSDRDMMGDGERLLCLHCVDQVYQREAEMVCDRCPMPLGDHDDGACPRSVRED